MEQMTREQAIAFAESGAWKRLTARQRAVLQMEQDKLCMPFDVFHASVEEALGRPVWTHEFALNRAGLKAELAGEIEPMTLREILGMLPPDRTLIVVPGAAPVRLP